MWYTIGANFMVEKPQRTDPFSIFWRLLRVGFETTTQHFWLLTIPLMLDILLWVGPRLRITHLAEPGLDWWMSQLDAVPQETTLPMTPDEISAVMVEAIERTNLLTQLTLPIVGVPVLMENLSPLKTPIVTANVSIDSPGALIANFVILTLLGLVLSTAYFSMIAQVVRTGEINWRDFGRNLLRTHSSC